MGREKEYRQRLKYQTQERSRDERNRSQAVGFPDRSLAALQTGGAGPEQIIVEAVDGRNSFVRNGRGATKEVKLTACRPEDLMLELEMGLAAMQLGRVLRPIE